MRRRIIGAEIGLGLDNAASGAALWRHGKEHLTEEVAGDVDRWALVERPLQVSLQLRHPAPRGGAPGARSAPPRWPDVDAGRRPPVPEPARRTPRCRAALAPGRARPRQRQSPCPAGPAPPPDRPSPPRAEWPRRCRPRL